MSFLSRPKYLLAAAIALTVLAYLKIFSIPPYLDDFNQIFNADYIASQTGLAAIWNQNGARFVTYLSFYVDHAIAGTRVAWYHGISLLLHLATGLSLYVLLRELLRVRIEGPAQSSRDLAALVALTQRDLQHGLAAAARPYVPPVAASLYLLLPLQVQAVSYIVQRAALLAAFFSLLALIAYVIARQAGRSRGQRLIAAVGMLLAGTLAIFSKQNAAVLPLLALLVEFSFFRSLSSRYLRWGGAAVAVAGGLLVLSIPGEWLQQIDEHARETLTIGRLDYFLTQAKVLWIYAAKAVVPYGLHIDYQIEIEHGLSAWSALALAGHLAALAGAAFAYRRGERLIGFGILFWYVAHLVESSLLPIRDVAFEHRAYLPLAGLVIVTAALLARLWEKAPRRGVLVLGALSVVYGGLTFNQVSLWGSSAELLTHNVRHAPDHYRAWGQLANVQEDAGALAAALASTRRAAAASYTAGFEPAAVHRQSRFNELALLAKLGRPEEARELGRALLAGEAEAAVRSRIYADVGAAYLVQGKMLAPAVQILAQAVNEYSANLAARNNLAAALIMLGKNNEATALLRATLALFPADTTAREMLSALPH